MSWTKKNVHPGKIVSTSQEVEVMVLDVDPVKRRISLGLKQISDNPWTAFIDSNPVGAEVEGEIKSITEFGLFIGLEGEIDGMVHLSDLDWSRAGDEVISEFTKGDMVKAKVLDVDIDKERISLGIKQLGEDPYQSIDNLKRGDTVTCTVAGVRDNGIEVSVVAGPVGFIRRADLARERSEQRPDRFTVGDKVDAMVSSFDRNTRKLTLSIKALEVADEKAAMAQYGSADSGASLGDILGAAIAQQEQDAAKDRDDPSGGEAADEPQSADEAAGADETAPVPVEAAEADVAEAEPVAEAIGGEAGEPVEAAAGEPEALEASSDESTDQTEEAQPKEG
jgi:small subunit ribosomal protein S1